MEWLNDTSGGAMAYVPIHPGNVRKEPKEPPPLVLPSMFWECAGVCTVYILSCVLAFLLVRGPI